MTWRHMVGRNSWHVDEKGRYGNLNVRGSKIRWDEISGSGELAGKFYDFPKMWYLTFLCNMTLFMLNLVMSINNTKPLSSWWCQCTRGISRHHNIVGSISHSLSYTQQSYGYPQWGTNSSNTYPSPASYMYS